MDETIPKYNVRWLSGTNLVAGLWLLLAPFVLGYTSLQQALWNDLIIGTLVLIFSLVRVMKPLAHTGISWANTVLGAWLIIAPFILGYGNFGNAQPDVNTTAAVWNDIIVGVVVVVLSAWSATTLRPPPSSKSS